MFKLQSAIPKPNSKIAQHVEAPGPLCNPYPGVLDATGPELKAMDWVAVKQLNLRYYVRETLLFILSIYPLW